MRTSLRGDPVQLCVGEGQLRDGALAAAGAAAVVRVLGARGQLREERIRILFNLIAILGKL